MATNCFRYKEQWFFGKKPDVYHGWVISLSGDYIRVAHFKSRLTCSRLERAIKAFLPRDAREDLITACLVIRKVGHENDWETAGELIHEEFESSNAALSDEVEEQMEKTVDDYCSKET